MSISHKESVLILDTKEQREKFCMFMSSIDSINFLYAETIPEAIQKIAEFDIRVVLVGCRINGNIAEEIASIISKEIHRVVHVVLNSFHADTGSINTQTYIQSRLFDIIRPTNNPIKVYKKILIALEAQKMEIVNSNTKGETVC